MERRSRATTGTTQKENGARSDGAKRRSVGRQTMARTGAKRRSEPGSARVFLLLMSCGYSKSPQKHHIHKASHSVGLRSVDNAPALRARILGGSLPVVSSLRDSSTGYCLSPLSGLQIPLANCSSNSNLSRCTNNVINRKLKQCLLLSRIASAGVIIVDIRGRFG